MCTISIEYAYIVVQNTPITYNTHAYFITPNMPNTYNAPNTNTQYLIYIDTSVRVICVSLRIACAQTHYPCDSCFPKHLSLQ